MSDNVGTHKIEASCIAVSSREGGPNSCTDNVSTHNMEAKEGISSSML